MFSSARVHGAICASCRLRACIATKQLARSRRPSLLIKQPSRLISTSQAWRYPRARPGRNGARDLLDQAETVPPPLRPRTVEEAVLHARQSYGDALPEGCLTEEEERVYERLYGKPFRVEEQEGLGDGLEGGGEGVVVLREGRDGVLEEVEIEEEEDVVEEEVEDDIADGDEGREEMVMSDQLDFGDDARLADDIQDSRSTNPAFDEAEADEETDAPQRTHPLTIANRFGPSPSTIQLPKPTFVDPATLLLSGIPPVHLSEAAHRVFGGTGLPYSTSTPAIGKTMQQKPIALDAYQAGMSEIEGDVYMATLMPAIYASTLSALAETRKRLGTAWAESLVRKAQAGELRILDAGGAGAGILAVREILRAEWERMHASNQPSSSSPTLDLAEADGKLGGAAATSPLGSATVLTGSDALRRRASQLLENTTFIPRLPDYVHTEQAKHKGKFDIVLAPHTLWPLREDYLRRTHTQNLWSLLSAEGGVLVVLEKGVARGFELVAAAREGLLETGISSPGGRERGVDIDEPLPLEEEEEAADVRWEEGGGEGASVVGPEGLGMSSRRVKDKGMIIAPCTNHAGCPMYTERGVVRGRKEICHFEQRYVRPGFLQKVLGARDKNWEDVKFSYLAVMRGRDLREEQQGGRSEWPVVKQGKEATERAFGGYDTAGSQAPAVDAAAPDPHSLTLPRAILAPIKRRGHVILDLCTPSGTLERWTVPRSFSRQAYRDARKSQWGDLWALGAKTRVLRTVRGPKKRRGDADMDVKGRSRKTGSGDGEGVGVDEYGRIVTGVTGEGSGGGKAKGGKGRKGGKVKGIRDKRDKKGTGNGRRKQQVED